MDALAAEPTPTPAGIPANRHPHMGAYLRELREFYNLDLETVSLHTRIQIRYIDALEKGALEVLPARTYARGYTMKYAEFLGLDPEHTIQNYPGLESAPKPTPAEPEVAVAAPAPTSKETVIVAPTPKPKTPKPAKAETPAPAAQPAAEEPPKAEPTTSSKAAFNPMLVWGLVAFALVIGVLMLSGTSPSEDEAAAAETAELEPLRAPILDSIESSTTIQPASHDCFGEAGSTSPLCWEADIETPKHAFGPKAESTQPLRVSE